MFVFWGFLKKRSSSWNSPQAFREKILCRLFHIQRFASEYQATELRETLNFAVFQTASLCAFGSRTNFLGRLNLSRTLVLKISHFFRLKYDHQEVRSKRTILRQSWLKY